MTEAQKSKAFFITLTALLLIMSSAVSQQYHGRGSESEELAAAASHQNHGMESEELASAASNQYQRTGSESEELDPKDVEEPGCPRVTHLKSINLRKIMGEWHLPYMSSHWIRYMAKRMHGKFMKKSSMGKTCVKMHVLPIPDEQIERNENASVWIHSKCPRTGAELNLACTPSEANNAKWKCHTKDSDDPEGDSWVYVVDTDEKDWALVVRCFPNNGMNWAIFSKSKMLDSKLVKSLLKEVEELGFQLFNVVEVPYEKCMAP